MWHCIFIGNGADAFSRITQIQSSFMLFLMAFGSNIEMAIFSKPESMDNANEETLYFSPAAADFAKTIDGVFTCEKPTRDTLKLLAGDARCLDALFPPSH